MVVQNYILMLFSVVHLVIAGKHDMYSGYTVHGVQLRDREDLRVLYELEIELDVDIWQYGMPGKRDALVMVSQETRQTFLDQLDAQGVTHYIHIENLVKSLNDHDEDISNWKKSRSNMVPFEDYPTYAEIDAYLEDIAARYPNLVTLVNSGPSFEGRAVKYLKISTTNFTDTSKPIYFIDAMLHAREWVTTPVALYAIHRLVEDLNTSDRDLLENVDWIIMPLVNPDGYDYSHSTVRLWRRTRSFRPEVSTTCYGVDANRNFDVAWNTTGVSTNPCSDVYPGPAPFSEPETGYVRDVLHEYRDRIQLFLDVHSHGNYVLFAYGDTTLPPNAVHVHLVGATMGAAMDALKLPHDWFYMVGNSAMVLYGSSGSAQDYGQFAGVPFSYTLELPGYGNGFLVPPQYIEHINKETWQGIAACTVHGVELRDVSDQKILYDLEYELDLDVWQYGVPASRDALVMITPANRLQVFNRLDSSGITYYLHISDVATNLEENDIAIENWKRGRNAKMVPFEVYPTYAEVDSYLERIAAQYPNLVTLVHAGPSFEGRAIKYLKISTTNFTDTSKPIYFMDATMHAREWVTTPVTLYSIHRLVEDLRDGDADLLNDTDWIVLPIVNPDGYEYTHTTERLWRRTRSYYPSVSTTCYGVDANRNFNISFNTVGVSSDPCSNVYPGPEPFSEIEAQHVRDILHEYQERIQLYLNIHSQGNLVLFGYGEGTLPDNAAQLHHVGAIMGAAIDVLKLPQALYYIVGNSGLVLYATSGTAQDYGQAVGIPFSLTLELPGYGYGHAVPPQFIDQINVETWAGIAASARAAAIYHRARQN